MRAVQGAGPYILKFKLLEKWGFVDIKELSMKKVILYGLWGFFYILCMVLGYTVPPETHGAQHAALTFLSLAFFVPPVLLLIDAYRKKEQKTFRILRTVSILSLALTFGALLLNVMSAAWP